jgi:hypothetical protein
MAFTGVLNAIDRDLVVEDDILVHGSGSYHAGDFNPIPPDRRSAVRNVDELLDITLRAVSTGAVVRASR